MSIPGLWIWGDRDARVPARESRVILESIITECDKDFTILYYPDAGHQIGWAQYESEMCDWIYAHIEE
jgi:pimeloyl-ACP methyl ester carboxylesterase